jgi:predicted pyridoxine 5'-phosphate oxidase superfamily flavin-nucleotide-binding protein
MADPFAHVVGDVAELRVLYREPSAIVRKKKLPRLDDLTRRFIEGSPFCLLATADADCNCEVSPRGGPPGFVRVLDARRLAEARLHGHGVIRLVGGGSGLVSANGL